MGELDLDAARAARAEAQDERYFTFGGERFDLPAEIPYEVVESLVALGDPTQISEAAAIAAGIGALPGLLGVEQYERFKAQRPAAADVNELMGWILREYGLVKEVGEGAEIDPKSQTSSAPSS